MQIWQTTWSTPRMSCTTTHENEASWGSVFCTDNASTEVLLHCQSGLFYFDMTMSYCVPECHQKGVKSSTGEKGFFQFPSSPLRGKQMKERSSQSLIYMKRLVEKGDK